MSDSKEPEAAKPPGSKSSVDPDVAPPEQTETTSETKQMDPSPDKSVTEGTETTEAARPQSATKKKKTSTKKSTTPKKSKRKHQPQVSIDDISINLSVSHKYKKNKKSSTPRTSNALSKKKKAKRNVKSNQLYLIKKNHSASRSKSPKSSSTKKPKLSKNNSAQSPKTLTAPKRKSTKAKRKKHGRERSRSDVGLIAMQALDVKEKGKTKSSAKPPPYKKKKSQDDTALSPKKKKRSKTMTPLARHKQASSTQSPAFRTSSLRVKTKSVANAQEATKRSASLRAKTPKSKRNRSKSSAATVARAKTPKPKKKKQIESGSLKALQKKNKKKQNKSDKQIPPLHVAVDNLPMTPDTSGDERLYTPIDLETPTPIAGESESGDIGVSPPKLDPLVEDAVLSNEDKPVRLSNKKKGKKSAKKDKKDKKFKKAVRIKSDKKDKGRNSPFTPVEEISKKYKNIQTPKTPKNAPWNAKKSRSKRGQKEKLSLERTGSNKARDGKRNSTLVASQEAQQHLEYTKMRQMYRDIKKDLKKLKGDTKALEIERRAIKREQQKLSRDREQFEVDSRTFNLKKSNTGNKKYGSLEEDKLRKMLYAERKQWSEERKNLRAEIMRLQGQLGSQRLGDKHRMSAFKRDILAGLNVSVGNHPHAAQNSGSNISGGGGARSSGIMHYSRQQKELKRFIRIEKQKAMKDLDGEKKRLAMLARQLRADHARMKKQRGLGAKYSAKQSRYNKPQKPEIRIRRDKIVKKIYVNRGRQRMYERKGNAVQYRPKEVRTVYRNLRKTVVLQKHDVDTRIKYLRKKQKQLNILKKKIVPLEQRIDTVKYRKRQNNKKKKKDGATKGKKKKKKKGKGNDTEQESKRRIAIGDGGDDDDDGDDDDEWSDSDWDSEIDGALGGDNDIVDIDDASDKVMKADPDIAKALEALDALGAEYIKCEQDAEKAMDGMIDDDDAEFEEEKVNMEADIVQNGDAELAMESQKMEQNAKKEEDEFEKQLLSLENELNTAVEVDFDQQVSEMEHIVSEQAEEAGTLREVVDSLSERLAAAQLEIDTLKELVRAAKRKQQLRDLYMKMAFSTSAPYKLFKSAHAPKHLGPPQMQHQYAQSGSLSRANSDANGITIVDHDGNEIMDIDKSKDILSDAKTKSESSIIKAANSVYAHGLIEDGALGDKNIVGALLDIIQSKGHDLDQHPQHIPVIKAALKALLPLLADDAAKAQFFAKKGVHILHSLFGAEDNDLKHVHPISSFIADCCAKTAASANESDKSKLDDIAVKLCRVAKAHVKDGELLHSFGGLLCEIDPVHQVNIKKVLAQSGLMDVATSCSLANEHDHNGACIAFGLCYDHVADVDRFLFDNPNVTMDGLIDAIDAHALDTTTDALSHVLDAVITMICADKEGKQFIKQLEDKGLEPVLMRALDNIEKEQKMEEKNDDAADGDGDNKNKLNNRMLEAVGDFYNSLCFEKLDPKMSQLKTKLQAMNVPTYGTKEWLQSMDTDHDNKKNDSDAEVKYEFNESDAIQKVKDRRHERVFHPKVADIGGFLHRMHKARADDYDDQQIGNMRRRAQEQKRQNALNAEQANQSRVSKIFTGMFKKKDKNVLGYGATGSTLKPLNPVQSYSGSLQLAAAGTGIMTKHNAYPMPNRLQQQQRMHSRPLHKNGRKRIPRYEDFMNQAFNDKIGRGLNEVQQVFNEMTHHTGMLRPVGSMLQKWYVLANHQATYWISQTNQELARYKEDHEDYYDMEEEEKYNDCWLLFDMKRKRLIQEIRWRNRGQMNDPKYVTIQSANHEETPWADVSNAFLEKTDDEQVIEVNKRARYWRIMFLGNHGEDTDDAPRFVFYEVQFWGRKHSTMNYSKASKQRRKRYGSHAGREDSVMSVSQSMTFSRPALSQADSIRSVSRFSQYQAHGDNARKASRYNYNNAGRKGSISGIEMTGKSKFATTPI